MRFRRGLALAFASRALVAAPLVAQTQTDMNAGASREAKAADATLNAQYKTTSARLSPASRRLLIGAQRSWVTFRDLECKFESAGVRGGSAYPMVYAGCLKKLSENRARQLKALSQCEEGDLSCPR